MPDIKPTDLRITYTDALGTVHDMRQPVDDYLTIDAPAPSAMSGKTRFETVMRVTSKASRIFDNFTSSLRRLPFPVDLNIPSRRPKRRRHVRGGLRPVVAGRVRKFAVHETKFTSDITGAPWIVEMQATKRGAVLG